MVAVMVVVKRQIVMLAVILFVVFMVRIMQLHETYDAYFFLVTGYVVDEVVEKFAQFENALDTLIGRRGSRKNQERKEYGEAFFHWGQR